MPWYPVKDYGDFALKFQWRDSGAGSTGNGGAFVRFPQPEEAVARPAAERYPCQVGSAQSDPAWVAIFCGHEIQINDNQASEPQKTGSVYNFSPLNATQAKVQPKGTWVDYEIRAVGQTYTISRNGEVLQTFQNTPGKQSSRAGDPPTDARQFARGYIGLQNHTTSDLIDYRNVRVLPLDAGSVKGPVTVAGNGQHKVEFRSTDVAGNGEDVKQVTFTIGGAGDTTAPQTTHTLDPAQPGAGGTYGGPVNVRLSATDPAEAGGGAPKTVDTSAAPSSWSPNPLQAVVGDTVRWNFPSTAQVPHDLWLIKPGEAPDSDGTLLITGQVPLKFPGDPPVTRTVDQAGTYTFVCKVHSSRSEGRWQGMVGSVQVSAGGSTPGSGVDFTEYRINTGGQTGAWVRSNNSAGADPFPTAFTVTAEGSHTVEYRSTDKAGNAEAVKSVSFAIVPPDTETSVDSDVSATVPLVLSLEVGAPATFSPLVPGVAHDYIASTTVSATSSAHGARLTVADRGSTAPGHLVNGELALPQALQAAAGGAFAPIGGASSPAVLKTWTGPFANAPVAVQFKQPVAATDALLVGAYRKTLTFTLAATTP
jgi:plastocyanin